MYLKNLSLDDFDETIFLNEKNGTTSPSKFTPFSKQGVRPLQKHFAGAYNHKKDKGDNEQFNSKTMNCKRILNYENNKTENETTTPTLNSISQFVLLINSFNYFSYLKEIQQKCACFTVYLQNLIDFNSNDCCY